MIKPVGKPLRDHKAMFRSAVNTTKIQLNDDLKLSSQQLNCDLNPRSEKID
jgi:hypothetical protein